MKRLFLILLFVAVSFSNSIAQGKKRHRKPSGRESFAKKISIKYGTASFYAKKFNGRKTANGDIYDSKKFTAACNVLPLNTWIRVTNLSNKKTAIVKINDRLHAKNKRLVDLSGDAARQLGYTGKGLTRVKVEVLSDAQLSSAH
ncbi:MAG: septal ring lytic transglycosylase RlpA family protein [Ginsengibacter sp.]